MLPLCKWRCDILRFMPACSVSSSSTLRPSKTQATFDGCFARQSICSVISLHSGMCRAVHPQEVLKVDVDHRHIPVWASRTDSGAYSSQRWLHTRLSGRRSTMSKMPSHPKERISRQLLSSTQQSRELYKGEVSRKHLYCLYNTAAWPRCYVGIPGLVNQPWRPASI